MQKQEILYNIQELIKSNGLINSELKLSLKIDNDKTDDFIAQLGGSPMSIDAREYEEKYRIGACHKLSARLQEKLAEKAIETKLIKNNNYSLLHYYLKIDDIIIDPSYKQFLYLLNLSDNTSNHPEDILKHNNSNYLAYMQDLDAMDDVFIGTKNLLKEKILELISKHNINPDKIENNLLIWDEVDLYSEYIVSKENFPNEELITSEKTCRNSNRFFDKKTPLTFLASNPSMLNFS